METGRNSETTDDFLFNLDAAKVVAHVTDLRRRVRILEDSHSATSKAIIELDKSIAVANARQEQVNTHLVSTLEKVAKDVKDVLRAQVEMQEKMAYIDGENTGRFEIIEQKSKPSVSISIGSAVRTGGVVGGGITLLGLLTWICERFF